MAAGRRTLGTSAAQLKPVRSKGNWGPVGGNLEFVTGCGEKGAVASEVAGATGIDVKQVYTYLGRLANADNPLLVKKARGRYMNPVSCVGSVGYNGQDSRETKASNTTNTTPLCGCGEELKSPASIRYGACEECRLTASNADQPAACR